MVNDSGREIELNSKSLGQKGITVAALTGSSRILGLARDVVLSSFFGAGIVADAFFVAFRVPNFFRRLLAEGAFSQAFIPVLSDYQEKRSREELEKFVQTIAGNFSVVLIAISILGVVLAPVFVLLFTLGAWQGDSRHGLATGLLRIMFPYLGLISFTAFLGAILNSFNRFAVPAFTPVLLNVALIAGALAGAHGFDQPVFALAWAVILGGVMQFAFHMPSLAGLKLLRLPKINWRSEGTRRVLKILGPAVYAASAGQVNILVGTILASQLVVGSVSWLYYADRLIELPVGMIAIAIQTVILPNLAKLHQREDFEGYRASLAWGVHVGIYLGIPASAGLCCISVPLISTLFFHGEFDSDAVFKVSYALQAFGVGVLPLMLVRILVPGYYARHDTVTPFKYASVSVGTNILVSLCLFKLIGHVGLAVATSVAAFVQAGLLIGGLASRGDVLIDRKVGRVLAQASGACVAMVIVLALVNPSNEFWLFATVWARIGWLGILIFAGMGTYSLVLLLTGVRVQHLMGRR